MVWRPRFDARGSRQRAGDRARGDRDVRGRPAGPGLRRPRRGGLRRSPARAPGHRARRGRVGHAGRGPARRSTARTTLPGDIVIAAAGSLDHEAVVELARAIEVPAGATARGRRRRSLPQLDPRVRFLRKETEQYHLTLGAPGLARDDERRFALRVLDNILGGTSSSRLFQEVRERRGLAYNVFSFQSLFAHTGQIGIYLGTRPDNVAPALQVVADELAQRAPRRLHAPRSSSAPRRTSRAAWSCRWSRRRRG